MRSLVLLLVAIVCLAMFAEGADPVKPPEKCIRRRCPYYKYQIFDFKQCKCVSRCPKYYRCTSSRHNWNSAKCKCIKQCPVKKCAPYHYFDHNSCECVSRCKNIQRCPLYFYYSHKFCECVSQCNNIEKCPPSYTFSHKLCRCVHTCRPKKPCNQYQNFDKKECKCVCHSVLVRVKVPEVNKRENEEKRGAVWRPSLSFSKLRLFSTSFKSKFIYQVLEGESICPNGHPPSPTTCKCPPKPPC